MSTLNINQIYKLDKIFTEEYFCSSLTKPPILKLSNIQEFLSHYKKQIHKQETSGEHLNFKTNQIYTIEFFFDDNQYYKISWNIDKAEQIIAEVNNISFCSFYKTLFFPHIIWHMIPSYSKL